MVFSIQNMRPVVTTLSNQLKAGYSWAYSRCPAVRPLLGRMLNTGKNIAWHYNREIAGALSMGIVLWAIDRYIKNRVRFPLVKMECSLDVARLRIAVPKKQHEPINVALTFCVDVSGSMKDNNRLQQVKTALNTLLDDAQAQLTKSPDAKISVSIVAFNDKPTQITPLTLLTAASILKVKQQIDKLAADGNTQIMAGLKGAIQGLRKQPGCAHTVVLLTDGESDIHLQELDVVQRTLIALEARLFAIGIGQNHKRDILNCILKRDNRDNAMGEYINASQDDQGLIGQAISKIYQVALARFSDFQLAALRLQGNEWSVVGCSVPKDGKYLLGALSEGEKIEKKIQINSKQLSSPLDLSQLVFQLSFKDPRGREGTLLLPWKPNTVIDPRIIA